MIYFGRWQMKLSIAQRSIEIHHGRGHSINTQIHLFRSALLYDVPKLELPRWEFHPVSRHALYSAVASAFPQIRNRMTKARLHNNYSNGKARELPST
jgi:hypothetical protein